LLSVGILIVIKSAT